ncbi:MAG: D-tyrosyl-tRNA(Tyr) deacylase [Myxococcales bacterium]|nr:D-tyrosyl-tRNA(Tyr) deacylase [Myxococcales bacterium]
MRAVVQRVSRAAVREQISTALGVYQDGGAVLGQIDRGLCVLLGIGQGDERADAEWLADKVAGLRIFPDSAVRAEAEASGGKDMNRSLTEVGGSLLVISQFTLYGDASKGRRPSFIGALPPDQAEPLYEHFVWALRQLGHRVATGRFGAMMAVEIVNDGPVTLLLDSTLSRGKPARGEA